MIKILVDADACPVRHIIEDVARAYKLRVIMIIDDAHMLSSEYSEIITVGKGKDAVDLHLINKTEKGDIVVTQDYGVAALALGRGAYAINQNGMVFTDYNIEHLLNERHISETVRRRHGGHISGFKKRTRKDDDTFCKNFTELVKKALAAVIT